MMQINASFPTRTIVQQHIQHECISRESNPGHINGNDVFCHYTTYAIEAAPKVQLYMFHFLTGMFFEQLHITLLNVHRFRAAACARLAQSAERKALNLVVVGSSPTVGVLPSDLDARNGG